MPLVTCIVCGTQKYRIPANMKTAKFCSYSCKYTWQKTRSPEQHGRWLGGKREKVCCGCRRVFTWFEQQKPLGSFKKQKYCSYDCSRKHQRDYVLKGKAHPRWKGGIAKRRRWTFEYIQWRKSVFERDNYTCQFCKKRGGDLEADHIKGWAEYPEFRFEVSNGRTLCLPCHRTTFRFYRNQYVTNENGAKSVKPSKRQHRASKA